MKRFFVALVVALGISTGVSAATFDGWVTPASGGFPVSVATWDIGGGNYLTLAGIQFVDSGDTFDLASANSGLISGAFDAMYVADPTKFVESVAFGDLISGALTLVGFGTLNDAIFVQYASTIVSIGHGGSGYSTFGTDATLDGNPLAAVPLPAAAWMLLAGLGGLVVLGRRGREA